MVASTEEEYEEKAVRLGTDAGARASLRARLAAARDACPLFDTEGWVRDFEELLLQMWDIHAGGGAPRTFVAQPLVAQPPRPQQRRQA
jgi:predicted O-linked N-acetylglucosamine transferase (SPINDLY family)